MNRKFALLFAFIIFSLGVKAEYGLLARNIADGKAVFLGKGASVRFSYAGYQQQAQEINGLILEVNDSIVKLQTGNILKKDTFSLAIQDIQGFRYYPISKQLAKLTLDIGLLTGNILFYTQVLSPAPISPLARVAISISAGALSWGTKKILFPDKINRTKEKGWDFVAYDAP